MSINTPDVKPDNKSSNTIFAEQYLAQQTTDGKRYFFKTETNLSMSFPSIITAKEADTDKKDTLLVDYERVFTEETDYRKSLVDILSKAENVKALSDLSTEDQKILFDLVDKLESDFLKKYSVDIDSINQDEIKALIDKNVVLISEFKQEVINAGMVNVLTK